MIFFYALELLKSYNIYKIFGVFSTFSSDMAEDFCFMHGCQLTNFYAMKCELKEKPVLILCYSLINVGVILGILVRFFEILDMTNREFYMNFSNGIWNVFCAITTVGFGDIVPITHLGRLVIVSGIFFGTFLISITIITFANITNFTREESKAYQLLKKYRIRNEIKALSGQMISYCIAQIKYERRIKFIDNLPQNVNIFKQNYDFENDVKRKSVYGLEIMNPNKLFNTYYSADSNSREKASLMGRIYKIKRKRNELRESISYLSIEMFRENFNNEDDKFIDIENKIDSSLKVIKSSLKYLNMYFLEFHKRLEIQRKLLRSQDLNLMHLKLLKVQMYSHLIARQNLKNTDDLEIINDQTKIKLVTKSITMSSADEDFLWNNTKNTKINIKNKHDLKIDINNINDRKINKNELNNEKYDLVSPHNDLTQRNLLSSRANQISRFEVKTEIPRDITFLNNTVGLDTVMFYIHTKKMTLEDFLYSNNLFNMKESQISNIINNCFLQYSAIIFLLKMKEANNENFNYSSLLKLNYTKEEANFIMLNCIKSFNRNIENIQGSFHNDWISDKSEWNLQFNSIKTIKLRQLLHNINAEESKMYNYNNSQN